MKVLMIGGTGFIGRHVASQLIANGDDVMVFHRGETNAASPKAYTEILGDRRRLIEFREAFRRFDPEAVIDMIAMNEDNARQLVETFTDFSLRLVVISSADVYWRYELLRGTETGELDPLPIREDGPLRKNLFPYRARAKSPEDKFFMYDKILVERLVMSGRATSTILRLPAVYGPGDRQHRLFFYLKRMVDGRTSILLEKAQMDWRWTRGYVENVAAAICCAVGDQNSRGRIYNVGETRGLTEFEWISSIGEEVGWRGQVVALDREQMPESLRSGLSWQHSLETDTSRIRVETGFAEPVPFREGLRKTIMWERQNPPEIKTEDFDYVAEDSVLEK